MKIKLDFITNSSSTTYIVCIPDQFVISLSTVENCANFQDLIDEEELSADEIITGMNLLLDKLRKDGILWQDDAILSSRVSGIYVMSDIMGDNDYIIDRLDSGADDEKIICLNNEEVEKIMNIKSTDILKDFKVKQ